MVRWNFYSTPFCDHLRFYHACRAFRCGQRANSGEPELINTMATSRLYYYHLSARAQTRIQARMFFTSASVVGGTDRSLELPDVYKYISRFHCKVGILELCSFYQWGTSSPKICVVFYLFTFLFVTCILKRKITLLYSTNLKCQWSKSYCAANTRVATWIA